MSVQKSSSPASRREERRKKKQQQEAKSRWGWITAGIVVLGLVAFLVWNSIRPLLGEEFPATGENSHVPENNPLPPYSTDPPTSGTHYPTWWDAGFYDETDPRVNSVAFPAGYLVHNLEHGYVIFWYNCGLVEAGECSTIKDELRTIFEEVNHFKVIAFPWTTTDAPVVATSWGRMLKMESFDAELARAFVQRNRNQAPESNAP